MTAARTSDWPLRYNKKDPHLAGFFIKHELLDGGSKLPILAITATYLYPQSGESANRSGEN